jgi:hypothetical protein
MVRRKQGQVNRTAASAPWRIAARNLRIVGVAQAGEETVDAFEARAEATLALQHGEAPRRIFDDPALSLAVFAT